MTQKILLIVGIGHSGSTILDMALGCHPRIIGLGEVSKVLRTPLAELRGPRYQTDVCSCGAIARECPFWGKMLTWLEDHHQLGLEQKYQELVDRFIAHYGNDRVMVDSSKTVRPYQAWLNQHHDLRAIHLTRDVRSWIDSRLRGHDHRDKGGTLRLAARWWRGNLRTERFLRRHHIRARNLGYEELALRPDVMLNKLCDWLDVDFDPGMLAPAGTGSHIIRGNRARQNSSTMSAIQYDSRWMTSSRLMLQSPLLLPLMQRNRRLVYANTGGAGRK